jgi:cardiolipin synthase
MIANILTILRVILTPFIVGFLLHHYTQTAFWLFAIAGISDFLDGYVARLFNQETQVGKILDPIADKILMISVMATLSWMAWMPLWLFIMVILRDASILAGFLYLKIRKNDVEIRPLRVSKLNTSWQVLTVIILLVGRMYEDFSEVYIECAVWILAFTTLISGVWYLIVLRQTLVKEKLKQGF